MKFLKLFLYLILFITLKANATATGEWFPLTSGTTLYNLSFDTFPGMHDLFMLSVTSRGSNWMQPKDSQKYGRDWPAEVMFFPIEKTGECYFIIEQNNLIEGWEPGSKHVITYDEKGNIHFYFRAVGVETVDSAPATITFTIWLIIFPEIGEIMQTLTVGNFTVSMTYMSEGPGEGNWTVVFDNVNCFGTLPSGKALKGLNVYYMLGNPKTPQNLIRILFTDIDPRK